MILIYAAPARRVTRHTVASLAGAAVGPAFFALVSLLITRGITAVPTPTTIPRAVRIVLINQIAASHTLGGGCFYSEFYSEDRCRKHHRGLDAPPKKPASAYLVRQLLQGFVYHVRFSLHIQMLLFRMSLSSLGWNPTGCSQKRLPIDLCC